ncbi:histidine phosphatase family protein [Paenibacillus filicis]|uniref:Histidine phosphatase family protein n=1 Tax=Paenibacillus filicis TaxID=669464 RepID=A0ABU9DGN9_9BACL
MRTRTVFYFVRHADSPYLSGAERSRGLSESGRSDAQLVRDVLRTEPVDRLISSPYARAILTIQDLADALQKPIELEEDLRERQMAGTDYTIDRERFHSAKRKLYEDWDYVLPGGESSRRAQARAVAVLERLLRQSAGKHIVIGTHGDIMTLMLNYFIRDYDFDFWAATTMPDIYKLEVGVHGAATVTRLWGN